jgi:uncharacterized protein YecE (DUF72 family)
MRKDGHSIYVYFDNDQKSAAPKDALALAERLSSDRARLNQKHSGQPVPLAIHRE